ncbi:SLC13 family permease [Aeromonas salmonicida]|uniref:SLC13 family permease n=1 Tax=Aeromonas salmonicida TaxID=645 RepID=UPI0024126292|nr:SLC13 family permease [Aeromonas salmonicida]
MSLNEIRRRFPLGLWLIVMAALALAKAMESSGLMASFSRIISYNLADISPRLSLLILLIVTWLVTELVTNNATAAMMTPIALALAKGMGVSAMPFVMAVAYAASCSFINPFSYQTNLMALRAGEYCILDYVKMGLPLSIFYISVLFFSIPMFFPF